MKFKDAPIGARFHFIGDKHTKDVYVKIHGHDDGLIVKWNGNRSGHQSHCCWIDKENGIDFNTEIALIDESQVTPVPVPAPKFGLSIHYTGDPSVGIMAETFFAEAPFNADAEKDDRTAFLELITDTYSQFCEVGRVQICYSDEDPDAGLYWT